MTEFQDWREVAKLVYRNSKRHVTMYRSIVSFGEDTAEELLLKDSKAWQRYIENHIRTIGEKNHIQRENLRWAAAMHKEKGHPHLHIVFWDNSLQKAKIRNPFTHPSVPDNIRRQMIKDTFSGRIRTYGEEKNIAAAGLRSISDELVADFEQHIRRTERKHNKKWQEQHIFEDLCLDYLTMNYIADRVFQIKEALPGKGRVAYQYLTPEVKEQVDSLVEYLVSKMPELQKRKTDYVESKMKMAYLYGGDDDFLLSKRKIFEKEAEKIIANRILGMIKTLYRLEDEGRTAEYLYQCRQYYMKQMVTGIFEMLSSAADAQYGKHEETEKLQGSELSKEAKKELYLRNQDRGYEH